MLLPPSHRIALVHDWLTGMRGGEKCLEVLCELFPSAPIYTLLYFPDSVSEVIRRHTVHASFIQRLPFARAKYRNYLPLFPRAIQSFDLDGYDLIISSSHAVAKGIRVPDSAFHICYMHTPMRYVWDMFDQYFGRDRVGLATYSIMRLIANRLRRWDVDTASSVDKFIANSQHVRDRIRRHYERDSHVIHPPVDTGKFTVRERAGAYFLVFSALVPYKRIDLAINAFNQNGLPLVVAGDGPDAAKLRSMAASNITFLGHVTDESLDELYGNAIALVFPGEEDFGIIPVEAMAAGKPVIAFGRGGALETVIEGMTGVFFQEQTVDDLISAIGRFHSLKFDPFAIQHHAQRFDRAVYKRLMSEFILQEWDSRNDAGVS